MPKFRNVRCFRWLINSLICLSIVSSATLVSAETETSAPGVIKTFNATLLDCMKRAKELGYSGRCKLLDPVVRDSFALSYMASISAGKYWKTLSEGQRRSLLDAYTEWSIATYAGRFDDYTGEKFEVQSGSKPVRDTVTVISKLIEPSKEETVFYYKLRKIEGRWRIVDIQISGVSQLALTRAQFVSVIGSKGFDGLISMLKDKIKHFSQ